ncbi:MAG: hypothetical protein ABR977_13815 [Candidatus Dormibacteria bacterium]
MTDTEAAAFGRRLAAAQGHDPTDASVNWDAYGRAAQGSDRAPEISAFRAKPSPSGPAGQPRPGPSRPTRPSPGPSRPVRTAAAAASPARSVVTRIVRAPADLGNFAGQTVANAATGGNGDTAIGRLLGALIAGALALEVCSLISGNFFNVQLGPWPAKVTPAGTSGPSGGSSSAASQSSGAASGSTSAQDISQGATGPFGTAPHTALAGA